MAKKVALKSPTKKSLTSTAITGGGAAAGFFGGQLLSNKVPQVSTWQAQGGIAAGALLLHASIEGSSETAEFARAVSAGIALHGLVKVGQHVGQMAQAQAQAEGPNGVNDYAAAALLPADQYYAPAPAALPPGESFEVFEEMGMQGMMDSQSEFASALNSPATEFANALS